MNGTVFCTRFPPCTQHQAFSYIHAVMNEDLYTEPDREEIARAVLDNFHVSIDFFLCLCVLASFYDTLLILGIDSDRCTRNITPGVDGLSSRTGRTYLQAAC